MTPRGEPEAGGGAGSSPGRPHAGKEAARRACRGRRAGGGSPGDGATHGDGKGQGAGGGGRGRGRRAHLEIDGAALGGRSPELREAGGRRWRAGGGRRGARRRGGDLAGARGDGKVQGPGRGAGALRRAAWIQEVELEASGPPGHAGGGVRRRGGLPVVGGG